MPTPNAFALVTGATGRQGGATARALVRDPRTEPAQAIQWPGAELVTGDLHGRVSPPGPRREPAHPDHRNPKEPASSTGAAPPDAVAPRAPPPDSRPAHVNDYDDFAPAYSTDNENNLINGYYERPAMIDLAGDVRGKHILDAGCGSGPLSAALREQGATMAGFDASAKMIEIARQRLGAQTELYVADLGGPLPFDDAAFDDVVCSLVLHYLQDWSSALAELHRVLKPGGRLIASLHHPIIHKMIDPEADYFATTQWSQTHTFDGQPATLTYWHRPLHAMTDAFTRAGFRITRLSEPPYSPHTPAELIPTRLKGRSSFLSFLFFVVHKD